MICRNCGERVEVCMDQVLNKTSLIILTYNQLQVTKLCIESIRKYTLQGSYEMIVVDNGSTDGTAEWLSEQGDIRCIFNKENHGFAKGCNQGIALARGSEILLLNNDTIVTRRWLKQLRLALYSDEKVGIVSCATNCCPNGQAIPVDYTSTDEIQSFANKFNKSDPSKWEKRIRLVAFCYLIKRKVLEEVGLLDEGFGIGNFEDDDYSLRTIKAGYDLLWTGDTFIHHFGSISFLDRENHHIHKEKGVTYFTEKWGFNLDYYANQRDDLIRLMEPSSASMRILEVGCGLGATLLQIQSLYPQAELHGIELNEKVAEVAVKVADVIVADIEKCELPFAEEYFDYIIFGDVLEHLYDPQAVIERARLYLKTGGIVLASIPNVMHWSVVKPLLLGEWTYQDAGILDRTHLRFFTRQESVKMFQHTGYHGMELVGKLIEMGDEDKKKFMTLQEMGLLSSIEEANVYQWLVKACK